MGMGIILGALSGAGDAAQKSLLQSQKADEETQLMQQRAQLEEGMREKFLAAQTANEDLQRQQMANRIKDAQGKIADQAIQQKYGSPDQQQADAQDAAGKVGVDYQPLTQEQQDVIDQAKAKDRDALMNDTGTYLKAGMQTGDVGPKEVGTIYANDLHRQTQAAIAQNKYETLMSMKEMQIQAMRDKYLNDSQTKLLIAAMRGEGSKEKTPANVATAEWLVQNGVAKDKSEAWDMVTSGKSKDPTDLQVRVFGQILGANPRMDRNQAWLQAGQLLDTAGTAATVMNPKPGATPNNPQPGGNNLLDSLFPKK
jgi:hypothetical protein